MHQEISARVHSFGFCVGFPYDERELEELLKTIEYRGGDYEHLGEPGWYVVIVPYDLDWVPFYQTVKQCSSVIEIDYREF